MNVAYNMDCMDAMKAFPDKFFNLAVVDPPYGINANKFNNGSGWKDNGRGSTANRLRAKGRLNQGSGKLKNRILNQSNCNWDSQTPPEEYFDELFRVSENCVIWGGNYFNLHPTRCIVVWDKVQTWENFSQVEIAWTSFDYPAKLFRYCNAGGQRDGESKIHPTQKPIALYDYIFKTFAKPGDKILDTHLGSGSSRIAAWKAGLDFWGYEINKDYFDSQEERFAKHTAQINLFLEDNNDL